MLDYLPRLSAEMACIALGGIAAVAIAYLFGIRHKVSCLVLAVAVTSIILRETMRKITAQRVSGLTYDAFNLQVEFDYICEIIELVSRTLAARTMHEYMELRIELNLMLEALQRIYEVPE